MLIALVGHTIENDLSVATHKFCCDKGWRSHSKEGKRVTGLLLCRVIVFCSADRL